MCTFCQIHHGLGLKYVSNMNNVENLLKEPFSRRSLEDKVKIKRLGRPVPNSNITEKAFRGKHCTYNRQFNRIVFDNNSRTVGYVAVKSEPRYSAFPAYYLEIMMPGAHMG